MTSSRLPRTLGLWSGIALVIGITIGSGIFRSPAGIARLVPSPTVMLGLWVLGGVITLCGALSLAELAAALPESGGFYAYLREGWGRPTAFLFGWAELIVIRASALGGISIVFGEYCLRSLGVDPVTHPTAARALAAGAIAFAAAANIIGARVGATIVSVSTVVKFAALGAIVFASLLLGGQHGGTFAHLTPAIGATITAGNFGLALVSVLWAYDGFGDLSLVGGEVKDPQRNLPRAIIGGTLAIIAIYLLANLAYLYMMPVDAIGRSPLVAADTMMAIFGRTGVVVVSSFVMISSFSSLNGIMLAAPRIFFAMADDGLLFGAMARVHPRFQTLTSPSCSPPVSGCCWCSAAPSKRSPARSCWRSGRFTRSASRRSSGFAAGGRARRGPTGCPAIRSCPPFSSWRSWGSSSTRWSTNRYRRWRRSRSSWPASRSMGCVSGRQKTEGSSA